MIEHTKIDTQGVCCICSRGLVFSQTVEATDINMRTAYGNWTREFTHNKPIPEAQNAIVEKARKHDPMWLWFVEEDMLPPNDALTRMLELGDTHDVVATKYKLPGGDWSSVSVNGDVKFTGLGCALIKLSVFDKIGRPYFSSSNLYNDELEKVGFDDSNYGQQDVFFFARLKECGIPFHLMTEVIPQHLKVVREGNARHNVGFHEIKAIE